MSNDYNQSQALNQATNYGVAPAKKFSSDQLGPTDDRRRVYDGQFFNEHRYPDEEGDAQQQSLPDDANQQSQPENRRYSQDAGQQDSNRFQQSQEARSQGLNPTNSTGTSGRYEQDNSAYTADRYGSAGTANDQLYSGVNTGSDRLNRADNGSDPGRQDNLQYQQQQGHGPRSFGANQAAMTTAGQQDNQAYTTGGNVSGQSGPFSSATTTSGQNQQQQYHGADRSAATNSSSAYGNADRTHYTNTSDYQYGASGSSQPEQYGTDNPNISTTAPHTAGAAGTGGYGSTAAYGTSGISDVRSGLDVRDTTLGSQSHSSNSHYNARNANVSSERGTQSTAMDDGYVGGRNTQENNYDRASFGDNGQRSDMARHQQGDSTNKSHSATEGKAEGSHTTDRRPSIGDRLMGTAKQAFGAMTHDEKVKHEGEILKTYGSEGVTGGH
ncbi:hypothetical protein IWQ60_009582 [Tieghemiomyces parasiticus]|uniref:Uncharacterized protein n=1 Tax=Tieghemiomyces parasiticus TaxID=78921 RepID=A0A9W7ZNX5_9FUNG|nr:hypothetical protein IWQ60_009582 [Tieghemiomyces parasiticus]